MTWPTATIETVARVNPRLSPDERPRPGDTVSFVPMAAVSEETLRIEAEAERTFSEVAKGYTPFKRGDVLIAKITPCFENGKMALADTLSHELGFGTTEFHVLRPSEEVAGSYLFHLLRAPYVRKAGAMKMKGAAGQRRVPAEFFASLQIPLPPVAEQRRIAAILDAADALRTKRRESLAQLDTLLQSTFLDMFGDPVTNPMGWKTIPFNETGRFVSGATPSKARKDYWVGSTPWVSPKDMKVSRIFDAQDHISDSVFAETNLKLLAPGHLLIVVRGMILAHSFPVAINRVPVAINQDMKGIMPSSRFDTCFLMESVRHLKRQILSEVSTAGHGTKRYDAEAMKKVHIPEPPIDLQRHFSAIVESVEQQGGAQRAHLAELDTLFACLQSRAFQGEL